MKDKEKYKLKQNHKNADGTKNRKRFDRHKKVSQLKKDMQLSRDKRGEKRKSLVQIQNIINNDNVYHILLIINETENNESVLLKKFEYDNGMYSLEMPIISKDVIDCNHDNVLETINKQLDVTAESVEIIDNNNLIIAKGIHDYNKDLTNVVIRTFNPSTWCNGDIYTTLNNVPYYDQSRTDIYLASTHDLGKIIISGHLLYGILDYRIHENKIEDYQKYNYYGGTNLRLNGTSEYVWTYTNPDIMKKLSNEETEVMSLLYENGSGKVHQDITKFLRFKSRFDRCHNEMVKEAAQYSSEVEYLVSDSKAYRDYNRDASEYFTRRREK